jgi:hypothetical protein
MRKTVAPLVINPFVVQQTASATKDDVTGLTHVQRQHKDPFGGLDTDLLAWMFRPKKVLCNQVFELEIDGTVFVSYPIVLDQGPLRLFNVIFAISTGYTGPSVGLVNAYEAVAKRLATTLLHEENRCAYVSEEVRKMFRVWSELRQANLATQDPSSTAAAAASSASSTTTSSSSSSSSSSASALLSPSSLSSSSTKDNNNVEWSERGAGDTEVDLHTLVDVCLARSLLACDIKDIYHKLRQQRMAQVLVNSFIPLSLSLRDPTVHPNTPIRPYQTLLLLKDESVILRSLPRDASPQLHRLIAVANPLKSFEELYIESGIPLAQLYRLAAHLVYWGCGRVVDTLTKHNMYMVHPGADLRPRSSHAMEFQSKFGGGSSNSSSVAAQGGNSSNSSAANSSTSTNSSKGSSSSTNGSTPRKSSKRDRRAHRTTSLTQLLSQISVNPGKVGDFLRGLDAPQQLNFIKMLIWLLRHDYLVQLHMYIHIVIPPEWIEQQPSMRSMSSAHHNVHRRATSRMGGMRSDRHLSSMGGMGGMSSMGSMGGGMSSMSSMSSIRRDDIADDSGGTRPLRRSYSDPVPINADTQSGSGMDSGGSEGGKTPRSYDEDSKLLGTSLERDIEELSAGSMSPVGSLKARMKFHRRARSNSFTNNSQQDGSLNRQPPQRGVRFTQQSYVQSYLDSIADDTPVYQMLKRLSPYFHGKHHVEEIMWRETVSRKAIQSVFGTYNNILSTTLHPKAASEW